MVVRRLSVSLSVTNKHENISITPEFDFFTIPLSPLKMQKKFQIFLAPSVLWYTGSVFSQKLNHYFCLLPEFLDIFKNFSIKINKVFQLYLFFIILARKKKTTGCLNLTSDGRLRSNLDNFCFKTGSFYDHENAWH